MGQNRSNLVGLGHGNRTVSALQELSWHKWRVYAVCQDDWGRAWLSSCAASVSLYDRVVTR